MAGDAPPTADGPFVNAFLCDQVVEEKKGQISLFRLVSDITVKAQGPGAPEQMPKSTIPIKGVISVNAGGRPGAYKVRMDVLRPSGVIKKGPETDVELRHDSFTLNMLLDATLVADRPGVYWFSIVLDGRETTRLPLMVRYKRETGASEKSAAVDAEQKTSKPGTH